MSRQSVLPRWRRVVVGSGLVLGTWIGVGAAAASADTVAGHRPPVATAPHADGRGGSGSGSGSSASGARSQQAPRPTGLKARKGARWS